ncbi:MAG: FimV/HubP family polar landmark protein [Methylococcales bacterium]|nr:FimV/HubP family polar landmark protein [Methylococcales bacterium]
MVANAPITADKPLIPTPATQPLKSAGYEPSKPPATVPYSAGSSYGPVHKKETLWSIAVKFSKERDASVEQTLMAIYEANPYAFHRNNVFGLLSGETLQIPDKAEVAKLSREEAIAVYNLQKKAWKNGVTLNSPDVIAPTAKASVLPPAVAVVIPEKVSKPAMPTVNIADNQPKEVTAESLKNPETSKETVVPTSEDDSLLDKVTALEKQLKATKKALASKEKQIDEIKSAQVAPAATTEPVVAPIEVAKPVEAIKPIESVVVPVVPVEVTKQVVKLETINPIVPFESVNSAAPLEAIKLAAPIEVIKPAEVAKPPVEALKPVTPTPVEAVKPVPPTPVEAVKPVTPTPVEANPVVPPEPESIEELVSLDSFPLIVGGGVAALVSVLGFIWWRKRKKAMETPIYPPSILVKNENQGISSTIDNDGGLGDGWNAFNPDNTQNEGESVFGNDWTNINIDEDQNDIDPISEADVYLAYGRYQQAEELMRDAIKEQPNRDECKLKLLELFYASENRDAFEVYVGELVSEGKKGDTDFWEKVVEMGSEICPDSISFSSGGNVGKATSDPALESDLPSLAKEETGFNSAENNVVVDKQYDNKDDFESVDLTDSAEPQLDNNDDFESFDFNDFAVDDSKTEAVDAAPVAAAIDSKDDFESFDFDDFALDSKTEVADIEPVAPAIDSKNDFESFDFDDFALDSKPEAADIAPVAVAIDTKDDFESFDFDGFALDSKPEAADIAPVAAAIDTKDDFESFDFDDFALDSKTEVADVAPVAVAIDTKDDFESFDFDDFALDSKPEVADVVPVAAAIDTKDDFESFDFDLSAKSGEAKELDDFDIANSDIDFDFDLDMPATALDGQKGNFGVPELTDMDEFETKLDLARAYIDMGDAQAARDIAEEVLKKGTAEQKKLAESILDILK